jgi:2-polyprenyl-6-methoxyphenol hydroxylase-like FAD-dependent oxidoreductase
MGVVQRGELRNKMLDELNRRGVEVKFGAEVVSVEDGVDMAQVSLNDGTSISGRAVAGCDGINSRTRVAAAPGAPALTQCGSLCLRGVAQDSGELRVLAGLERTSTEAVLMWVSIAPGLGLNMTLFQGVVTWVFEFVHDAPLQLTAEQARQIIDAHTKDWAPVLRRLLLDSTAASALHLEPLQDLGGWGVAMAQDRVTLLGDAAHPLVWTGGAGSAIRDAVGLADVLAVVKEQNALQSRAAVSGALRRHESAMALRVPTKMVLEVRERLPTCIGGGREAKHQRQEEKRPMRWERQQKQKQGSSAKAGSRL